ncbi:hypothetical protein [Devosia pacifica]|nr:hypothetical protein [Devosia pacifica]
MQKPAIAAAITTALMAAGTTSAVSESNTLSIVQGEPGSPGTGNSIFVDQSSAAHSEVGGLSILVPGAWRDNWLAIAPYTEAALQLGSNNNADIQVSGTGGNVVLYQNNPGTSLGNTATISLDALHAAGIVGQYGSGNIADVAVSGTSSVGSALQNGDGNRTSVTVDGWLSSGTVIQNGDGNDMALSVQGDGTVAKYVQNGNNLAPATAMDLGPGIHVGNGGVSVVSNGATVHITQTRF